MNGNTQAQAKIIEPEVLDENGQPIIEPGKPSAHGDVYGRVGFLTGFFALVFSFVMILVGVLAILIFAPLLLIGRIFGLQIKNLKR